MAPIDNEGPCPSAADLSGLIQGQLELEESVRLQKHVSRCRRCGEHVTGSVAPLRLDDRTGAVPAPAGLAEPTGAVDESWSAAATKASGVQRGTNVGRYMVLDKLGQGGMGEVYAAYDPELDRRVALKLLHQQSADASDGHTRLLREAQAAAKLSHPNVVGVHDVGTFDKRVFVAMELVEGHTLRDWLKDAPRHWREVLKVMAEAGRGLGAAHAVGLVHRDFKPDNVLVGKDGRVRVADFGLARLAGTGRGSAVIVGDEMQGLLASPLTVAGAIIGTPAYMAPEQLLGGDLDARTDVFSFCVTLYEALYGERPFDTSGGNAKQARLEGRIKKAPRQTEVPAWVRRVVLRGLAVKPEERFPGMAPLLHALASDPNVRRRKWLTRAALALVTTGALAYSVQSARQSRLQCKGAEQRLAGVWDATQKARVRKAFAATGKPFAGDAWRSVERALDAYAERWTQTHVEACEATRVQGHQSEEVLSLRMACLQRRSDALGSLVSVFADADAQVVEKAQQATAALADLKECSDLAALTARVRPPSDAATRQGVEAVSRKLSEAKALLDSGRYAKGLEVAKAATAQAKALPYKPAHAEALVLLGSAEERAGATSAALQTLQEALRAAQASRHAQKEGEAWIGLVGLSHREGLYKEGDTWAGYAGAVLEGLGGDAALEAQLELNVGVLRRRQGRVLDSLADGERAVVAAAKAFGEESVQHALALNARANVHQDLGKYQEAVASYSKAHELLVKALGPAHPLVALPLTNMAKPLVFLRRAREALEGIRRAVEIEEQARGESVELGRYVSNLGEIEHELGLYDAALAHYRRSEEIRGRILRPGHPELGSLYYNIAAALTALGRTDEALSEARKALDFARRTYGADHWYIAPYLQLVAEAHAARREYPQAVALVEESLEIRKKKLGPEHVEMGRGFELLGKIALEQGRAADALAHSRRALEIFEKTGAAGPVHLAAVAANVGRALSKLGRTAEALPFLERAAKDWENLEGPLEMRAAVHRALAQALEATGTERERARKLEAQASADLAHVAALRTRSAQP